MTETRREWKGRRNECDGCGKPTCLDNIEASRPGWTCKRCVRRSIALAKKAQAEWALTRERLARLQAAQARFRALPKWEQVCRTEAALFAPAD